MILITGATGYIGRHLVNFLVEQGVYPRCLVRNSTDAARILPTEHVDLVQGDTLQPQKLASAVQGIETIVHAAFVTADRKPLSANYYNGTNVEGTANLIKAAEAAGVKRIIEISGLGTKPDKPGSYMQGRYLAEQLVKESRLDWTIIQPSVLFGKGAPFIKGLTDLIKSAPIVPLIGGGSLKFQPIFVDDVVKVIGHVINHPGESSRKIYTIGGPEQYTFEQIIDELLQASHKQRLKVYAPTPLVAIGAGVMEKMLPKPPLTSAAMTLFSFDNITDINSVERDFGFKPLSFHTYLQKEGLQSASQK